MIPNADPGRMPIITSRVHALLGSGNPGIHISDDPRGPILKLNAGWTRYRNSHRGHAIPADPDGYGILSPDLS